MHLTALRQAVPPWDSARGDSPLRRSCHAAHPIDLPSIAQFSIMSPEIRAIRNERHGRRKDGHPLYDCPGSGWPSLFLSIDGQGRPQHLMAVTSMAMTMKGIRSSIKKHVMRGLDPRIHCWSSGDKSSGVPETRN